MSNKYVLLLLLLCVSFFSAYSQTNPEADSVKMHPQADSLIHPPILADSLALDSLPNMTGKDSLQENSVRKSDIETTVNYSAKDSIRLDFRNKTMHMYSQQAGGGTPEKAPAKKSGDTERKGVSSTPGNAKIDYGPTKLEAAYISMNWENNLLAANGVQDSTGKIIGKPLFTDGPEQFVTNEIRYNFKTRKAIIKGIVSQQQDGYIHGETVKKTAENELLIENAIYTTCNLEDPHFHIAADKLKRLPNGQIVSGPFHLRFADIPTPLGFLFGMFPPKKERASGIIMPSYGEERRRGFFLRGGGYYTAINDYIDLQVTGEIYTKGSRGIALGSNYRKRYAYNGNFNIRYNRQDLSDNEAVENISKAMWVTWSHAPQSRGKGRFTASVNGGSTTYTTNNPSLVNMARNLNQQFSSNVSYSYSNLFNSPFSINTRANMTQDVSTGGVNLTLPDVGVNMARQFPFKKEGSMGKTWYEQIGVGYSFTATNKLSNAKLGISRFPSDYVDPLADSILPFWSNLPIMFDRAKIGAQHSIPISTSFNILKHFQVSPSFNYSEYWLPRKLNYSYNDVRQRIEVDTVEGFARAGVYNMSTGLSTKLFGTFHFNKRNPDQKIQAIRHMMIPTVGFSYRPDFTREKFGYFQNIRTPDPKDPAKTITQTLNVFDGNVYSVPAGRESGSINFNLTNNFEMKVKSKADTVKKFKKISLLRSLNFSTGYDLIAEEFNLQPIRMSGNTSFLNNLISFNFGATLDPYIYERTAPDTFVKGERRVTQERVSKFAWTVGQGIGNIDRANFNISSSLSPSTFKGEASKDLATNPNATSGVTPPTSETSIDEDLAYIYNNPNEYVNFNIPWTLRFNYSFNYSKSGFAESTITQSANFSGDLKITEKWKLGFNSGYDFRNKQFTQTSLNIYRDLHCWQMNVSWIPFGRYQSFSVDINVKSSMLQDLKLSRRRTWMDL